MIPTCDPYVFIESQQPGYIRYWCADGRRWEVIGVCDRRGNCMIGAVVQTPDGLVQIQSVEHLTQLCKQLMRKRVDSELDVPVGPGFSGCCNLAVQVL